MDPADTRGAGGRAPRQRASSTPGKLLGLVASPISLISRTVKGLVSPRERDAGAATPSTLSPQQLSQPASAVQQEKVKKTHDGPGSFSFPTLTGSDDSPPTTSLLRPVAAAPTHQGPPQTGDAPAAVARGPMPVVNAGPVVTNTADLINGWSPSKLASLNFFLSGASQLTLGQGVAANGMAPPPAPMPVFEVARQTEVFRPFQGLKALLRAGPGGFVSGGSAPGSGAAVAGPSSLLGSAAPAHVPGGTLGYGASARAPAGSSLRYQPYGRSNAGRPPRPGSIGGSLPAAAPAQQPSQTAMNGPGPASAPAQHMEPAAEQEAAHAVAAGQLPPPNPRPSSGAVPKPTGAIGGVRLAPGQVAFASGRTGTPLPKFGPAVLPAPAVQQPGPSAAPGGFRPLAGAVAGKRARESPAASPLMSSGIRSLSEFKRRRQAIPSQPRSILAGLSARTPRGDTTPGNSDGERTPGVVGNGASGATPSAVTPAPGSAAVRELPATDTARKILETLENYARAGDSSANTPHLTAAKAGAHSGMRSGMQGSTPLPGPFMPPLDRLDQNHYGGTPAATPSFNAGAAGYVSGTTPSPAGINANAGHTPGPRIALDFQSPATSPAPPTRQPQNGSASAGASTTPLPLSPIAVPPAAATSKDVAAAATPSRVAAVPVVEPSGVQAAADTSSPAARTMGHSDRGLGEPHIGGSAGAAPAFSFRDPGAPTDPRLRHASAIAGSTAIVSNGGRGDMRAPTYQFEAPLHSAKGAAASGLGAGASAERALASTAAAVKPSTPVHEEVAKAAAVPLPDDDEDDGGAGPAEATPAQPPVPSSAPRRVAFVEQPPTHEKNEAGKSLADASKGAALAAAATPPASPLGFAFTANAGSTPFRPLGGQMPPETPSATPSAAADKDATKPSVVPFSFGASGASAAPTAEAAAPAAKPAPAGFSFGVQPAAPIGAMAADKPVTEAAKPPAASGFSFGAAPAAAASSTGDAQTTTSAPAFGTAAAPVVPALTFGVTGAADAAVAAKPAAGFSFGATPVPAFGAPANTSASAPAAGSSAPATAAAAQPPFGVASQPSSANPTSSPAAAAASSSQAPAFGLAPASAPAAASSMFTFGAASSAPAAASSSAPIFAFGGSTGVANPAAAPAVSFGSPLPSGPTSSGPAFGSAQPAEGFGSGFGASSGPASSSFTFGAQAGAGSGQPGTGGFGAQAPATSSAPTFSFGAGASAPSFGAPTTAPSFGAPATTPSFGAAPSPAPTFGTAAPAFGATNPANPFGAAAPSFGATPAAPTFGAPASSAPAFGAAAAASAPSFGSGFGAPSGSSGPTAASGMFTFGGGAPASTSFGAAQTAAGAPAFGAPSNPAPTFGMGQQAPAPSFGAAAGGFGSAPGSFGAAGGFGAPPAAATGGFGAAGGFGAQPGGFGAPPSPGGDAGGGFSLGVAGEPKDRKRVKARRHGGH